jgi:hypothetical protein
MNDMQKIGSNGNNRISTYFAVVGANKAADRLLDKGRKQGELLLVPVERERGAAGAGDHLAHHIQLVDDEKR